MKNILRRICSVILTVVICFASVGIMPCIEDVAASTTATQNIAVDINGSENRGNLKSPVFNDWTLTKNTSPANITIDGVSFTLTASSGAFTKSENKTLMATAEGKTPFLTCDGACIETDGTSITLKISGLSAGTHTLTTWHSYFRDVTGTVGALAISVNGTVKNTITPSTKVGNDLDAAISYIEFDVTNGQSVEIKIEQAEQSTGYDVPVLNAFEVDGAHPTLAITNVNPEHNDTHHDPEEGLSWTAGDGAVSHDVYLGTDEYSVSNATTSSAEYKGRQNNTTYAFDETLSHMEDYYWRIDEIDSNGNVVKGKVYHFQVRHLAFPTAEGYGRFAKGGRGGQVVEVTTLEDNENPGSLRYALTKVSGPRIIVFRVGGVIELKSKLNVTEGNFYLAGQTAPGDGITVTKYNLGCSGCEDVIIRNVRVRVGDSNGRSTDGMGLGACSNSIIDHCSISWATDEGFSSRDAKDITLQYTIIGESLHDSVHYNGDDRTQTETHAFAATIGGDIGSFHHNLLINCTGRNWSLRGTLESDNKTYYGKLDISNNVVYNWYDRTTDGGNRRTNFVNNFYKMGWQSKDIHFIALSDTLTTEDCMAAYVSGNVMQKLDGSFSATATDDAWAIGKAKGTPTGSYTLEDMKSDEPFFPNYINLQTAEEAYETVIKNAGANYPKWDYIDSRYIKEVTNTTYTYRGSKQGLLGIIDSQEDVGGYPTSSEFSGGTAPADSDHDGMPDAWETEHKLDPNNAADGSIISLSAEGYTNVEMYLNELMGDSLVWSDGTTTVATPKPTNTPVVTVKPTATSVVTETPTPEPTATSTVSTETPEPTTPVKDVLKGDVDLDGVVDATDALLVLKHAAKLEILDDEASIRAELDDNGSIDAADALMILKIAAKLI